MLNGDEVDVFLYNTNTKKPKIITECGDFYVKAIIHITEINDFEVIEEEFFSTLIKDNKYYLDDQDLEIYIENELKEQDFIEKKEVGKYYSLLWNFNIDYTTDYFGEHDSEIITIDFKVQDYEGDIYA